MRKINLQYKDNLGRDESLPGYPFIRLINPTDFDIVREAMRKTIKEKLSYDLFNPLAWKTIGLTGGPIDKFLIRYKETSILFREAYSPANKREWFEYFQQKYNYDNETLEIFFDTFWELQSSNKIADTMYRPYNYKPSKTSTFDKYLGTTLQYAIIGGVAYLLIRSIPKVLKR
jgi:hypothetical protein